MKKVTFTIFFSLIASATLTFAQSVVLEDFDNNRNMNYWSPDKYMVSTETAPGSTSDTVGLYDLTLDVISNGNNYMSAGFGNNIVGTAPASGWESYDVLTYPYISVMVYSDTTMDLTIQIKDKNNASATQILKEVTETYSQSDQNAWKTLYYDFSSLDNQPNAVSTDQEWTLLFDNWNNGAGAVAKVFYLDDFMAYQNDPTSTEESNATISALYPNPASDKITIDYSLETSSEVSAVVSDVLGNTVKEVELSQQAAGNHSVTVDVSGLASGLYVCNLVSNGSVITKSFIVE